MRLYTRVPPLFCPFCGRKLDTAARPVIIAGWFEVFCKCRPDPCTVADDAVKLPSTK